jgi:hypothetical protein
MSRNPRSRRVKSSSMSHRRIRATLGELIAAAYDALGPDAGARDVARLLSAPILARGLGSRYRMS